MKLDIDLNVSINIPGQPAPAWALELKQMLGLIIAKENQIMSAQTDALDQAEAAAAANSAADDSAEALLVSLAAMITDLKNSQTDPATTDRITALATALTERASRLSAAVVAGTPSAPVPAPTPDA